MFLGNYKFIKLLSFKKVFPAVLAGQKTFSNTSKLKHVCPGGSVLSVGLSLFEAAPSGWNCPFKET